MNASTATLLLLLVAAPAYAQKADTGASKESHPPTAKQQAQRDRMKSCNAKAADRKGDDRRKFMSDCLSDEGTKPTAQQQKMKDCNAAAGDKKLKGDERKRFMSTCLKG